MASNLSSLLKQRSEIFASCKVRRPRLDSLASDLSALDGEPVAQLKVAVVWLSLSPQLERANDKLNDINALNKWLQAFGMEPRESKTQALRALRRININIFDLLDGNLDRTFDDVASLGRYSSKQNKIFPLELAKSEGLKAFLREIARHFSW